MAKYINHTLFYWISKFVNDNKNERLTPAGWQACRMLIDFHYKDIVVKDGYMVMCVNGKINTLYSASELKVVENEMSEELKNLFGMEATVEYKLTRTEEKGNDSWNMNYYSLLIKAKLPE